VAHVNAQVAHALGYAALGPGCVTAFLLIEKSVKGCTNRAETM
jgi:hypothetical protein